MVAPTRLGQTTVRSRYAGAMLLHGFLDRVGTERVFAPLAGPAGRRGDDVALLSATTCAFALGVSSMEATKHLIREQVGTPRRDRRAARAAHPAHPAAPPGRPGRGL